LAEIVVVAPERNRSGASNSLTLDLPLHLGKAANGHMLCQRHADRLRASGGDRPARAAARHGGSGINLGANMGDDTIYSGTVAAATEGYLLGVPAHRRLAGELCRQAFRTAGRVVRELVQRFTSAPFNEPVLLNVNVPDVPYGELRGIQRYAPGTPSQGRAGGEIGQPARRNAVLDRPGRSCRRCRRGHGFPCRGAWLGVGHAPADRPDPRAQMGAVRQLAGRRGMNSAALTGIGMTSQRTRARMVERLRDQGITDARVLHAIGVGAAPHFPGAGAGATRL
jgi:hypothetical protein